ncbi:hypothetical protein C8Q78DRAFT_213038 [Trametes maxima]|nr:hypothetical protein C8Q78DRAFT_213038 [Trametes maxima]
MAATRNTPRFAKSGARIWNLSLTDVFVAPRSQRARCPASSTGAARRIRELPSLFPPQSRPHHDGWDERSQSCKVADRSVHETRRCRISHDQQPSPHRPERGSRPIRTPPLPLGASHQYNWNSPHGNPGGFNADCDSRVRSSTSKSSRSAPSTAFPPHLTL